ncbi:MAG: hypothetical protein J2P27_00855 [Actinobacteria bacterium]|nr:hypothetical protein [Actinomycetota bacterium]
MTAYVLLYAITAAHPNTPFWATSTRLSADAVTVAIAAFLAWRVTRGGSAARVLVIVWTVGQIGKALSAPDFGSAAPLNIGLLAVGLVQLALLVSTPIYDRTRERLADRPANPTRLWPVPPSWMAGLALAAGLLVTLLFLGNEDFQTVPCATPPSSASAERCHTLAEGFPIHFLSASPDGNSAYPTINKAAAAEDIGVWTVLSFAACYLMWLPSRRQTETAAASIAAPA